MSIKQYGEMKENGNNIPKVSVVVPCLNVERYIADCLESIVGQTLRELEILVIDAGSSDGTQDILDAYVRKDERVQVIKSIKKSYGYQVNLGIRKAAGQYIAIVDADDKIAYNMYEVLYDNACCSDADYVKGTARCFYTVSKDYIYEMPLAQFPQKEYREGKIELVPMERSDLLTKDNFLWYGIFRRELMKEVIFHESSGAAFQDFGGLLQTQMKAGKAVYLEDAFYGYRQDNDTSSFRNPKGFQFVWEEYSWAEQFIVNASDEWKCAFYKKMFLHTLSIYYKMAADGIVWDNCGEYIKLIREKVSGQLDLKTIGRENFSDDEWEDLRLLLESPSGLYHKYREQYQRGIRQIMEISKVAADGDIVIFGCGIMGQFVYAQLRKHGLGSVTAFCDNRMEKQGLIYDDVTVLSPLKAAELYPKAYFVITSIAGYQDMERQLRAMEIPFGHICAYTAGPDMYLFGEGMMGRITGKRVFSDAKGTLS